MICAQTNQNLINIHCTGALDTDFCPLFIVHVLNKHFLCKYDYVFKAHILHAHTEREGNTNILIPSQLPS